MGRVVLGVVMIDVRGDIVVPSFKAEPFYSSLADAFARLELIAVLDDMDILNSEAL